MHRLMALILLIVTAIAFAPAAHAQPTHSRCLAVAQKLAPLMPVAYRPAALQADEVSLTFIGHSTFVIESPEGLRIATDYSGHRRIDPLPDLVTMNHAHSSHYTPTPDPGIRHVLRGWNPDGGHADHRLTVGDVFIRNIPTNIRTWEGGTEEFGNSIFIFETASLCIGHLGHLHHTLTEEHLAQIGQLDVVMFPVDGSYTLDHPGMAQVLRDLRARIVIPMHYFGTLDAFIARMGDDFTVRRAGANTVIVSQRTMPAEPELLIVDGPGR